MVGATSRSNLLQCHYQILVDTKRTTVGITVMENLSKLKTVCRASVTKHVKTHRLSTNNEVTSVRKLRSWRSTAFESFCLLLNFLFKWLSYLLVATFILYHFEPTHESILVPLCQISRFFSLMLDLHKFPLLQGDLDVHYKACFLLNPYYEFNSADCHGCSSVKEADVLTGLNESEFRKNYYLSAVPLLHKNSFETPINLANLKQLLSENLDFENYPTNKYSHVDLQINPTNLSRTVRKIFPAPSFLPQNTEMHFQQTIYFDGPLASEYSLPYPYYGNVIILQAKGRRMVKLLPVWRCQTNCSSVTVVLEPGDALHYAAYFWRVFSEPVHNNNETEDFSITNFGCFVLKWS